MYIYIYVYKCIYTNLYKYIYRYNSYSYLLLILLLLLLLFNIIRTIWWADVLLVPSCCPGRSCTHVHMETRMLRALIVRFH